MLKIIGKLKLPKTWAVTKIKSTGHYIVDYLPDIQTADVINHEAAESRLTLAATYPAGEPAKPKWRNRSEFAVEAEWKAAYAVQGDVSQNYNRWASLTSRADKEALDYHPIFEALLTFNGYSRGRSKVTMDFLADNGQEIPFGASGVDGLMTHIANGNIKITAEGKYHVVFTLEKKGSNIYAYPHYPETK